MDYAAVTFGYRYRSPAVLGVPDDAAPVVPVTELSGQPGTRAPHVELERGGQRISTIDLFGRRLVLLTGPHGDVWVEAARRLSARLGLELDAYRIGAGSDLVDASAPWLKAYGLGSSGAVLVRPDGVVAWRSQTAEADPKRTLESVLGRLLHR